MASNLDVVYEKVPTRSLYEAAMFGATWARKTANGFGTQGYVDLNTNGSGVQGLRLSVARTVAIGEESNGFEITLTIGLVVAASYDADAKKLALTALASTTQAALKAIIELVTDDPIIPSYYGGETGTGLINSAGDFGVTWGATADRASMVEVRANGGVLVHLGTAAPSADSLTQYIRPAYGPWIRYLPAGWSVWTKRLATSNTAGGIMVWEL